MNRIKSIQIVHHCSICNDEITADKIACRMWSQGDMQIPTFIICDRCLDSIKELVREQRHKDALSDADET